jgi:protocatechuate 3,4-dioxygenase beta subunit
MTHQIDEKRRCLLSAGLCGVGLAFTNHWSLADTNPQTPTPRQSKGPFYPIRLPLDKDNDLVRVAGQPRLAKGQVVDVVGRIVDERGRPVCNARVEIWQCDANGRYRHPWDRQNAPMDPNFQGYGRYLTGSDGAYRFRTIKPIPYPGRAPHIHFAISGQNFTPLITQMYVASAPENAWDPLLNGISDTKARQRLLVAFEDNASGQDSDLIGHFEIVLAADGRYGR